MNLSEYIFAHHVQIKDLFRAIRSGDTASLRVLLREASDIARLARMLADAHVEISREVNPLLAIEQAREVAEQQKKIERVVAGARRIAYAHDSADFAELRMALGDLERR